MYSTSPDAPLVRSARRLALMAHVGQVDQTGRFYFIHLGETARRAARLARGHDRTSHIIAAAWLHNVVTDTDWDIGRLSRAGMPTGVTEVVTAVSRQPGEQYETYIERICCHSSEAVLVQIASLEVYLHQHKALPLDHPAVRRFETALTRLRCAVRPLGLPAMATR